ncbi:MAG: HEAT repeat domain-containing protein, partial [Planctomycetes bacterium]|nr:HEAT repeat domain-containing protein [Planctomycetota bacterium]
MSQQPEPARGPAAAFGIKRSRIVVNRPLVVILLLLALIWLLVMVFRWELRAQWWAYQVTQAESREQREFYVTRLASIRNKSLHAVSTLIEHPSPEVRDAGVTVLRYCDDEEAAERLFGLLSDPSPDVAAAAATTLAWRSESARYVPRLAGWLQDRSSPRWGVAVALGRLGGSLAEESLEEALAIPCEPDVRAQIIDSLGLLGCTRAVPLIIDALADDRPVETLPHSLQSAKRALEAVRGQVPATSFDWDAAEQQVVAPQTVAAVAAHWIR